MNGWCIVVFHLWWLRSKLNFNQVSDQGLIPLLPSSSRIKFFGWCMYNCGLFALHQLHFFHFQFACLHACKEKPTHLVKDMVECVLVVKNTPSKDKTLVCSRDDGGFCVQSSDNQFLELVYRGLSADHDREPVGGMARRGDVYDEGLCSVNLFHDEWVVIVYSCRCCVPFVRSCCGLVSAWCVV